MDKRAHWTLVHAMQRMHRRHFQCFQGRGHLMFESSTRTTAAKRGSVACAFFMGGCRVTNAHHPRLPKTTAGARRWTHRGSDAATRSLWHELPRTIKINENKRNVLPTLLHSGTFPLPPSQAALARTSCPREAHPMQMYGSPAQEAYRKKMR